MSTKAGRRPNARLFHGLSAGSWEKKGCLVGLCEELELISWDMIFSFSFFFRQIES